MGLWVGVLRLRGAPTQNSSPRSVIVIRMINEVLPRESIVQLKTRGLGLGCRLVCIRPWAHAQYRFNPGIGLYSHKVQISTRRALDDLGDGSVGKGTCYLV